MNWNEFYRKILTIIDRRISAALITLVANGLPARTLPAGTMIDRGDYSPTSLYRQGDLVVYGGNVFVAIRGSTGIATSDTTYWRPLGGTSTDGIIIDEDGNVVTDEDGEIVVTG